MHDVQTSFRMPMKLEREVEMLVSRGFYKSKSELYITGIRKEVVEAKKISSSVVDARKARQEMWKELMRRAGGDFDRAFGLMKKDAEEEYAKNPDFWK
jgi:Arc/MetJ-type ribon-helix-helix transcriptional regulator